MVQCSVKYCTSDSRHTRGISFFSFPRNIALRNIWIAIINRKGDENWNWSPSKRVCCLHFDNFCIVQHEGSQRRFLKNNSVSSLLLGIEQETLHNSQSSSSSTLTASPNELTSDLSGNLEDITTPTALVEKVNEGNVRSLKKRKNESSSDSSGTKLRKSIKLMHSYCASPSNLQKRVDKLKENAIKRRKKMHKIKMQNQKLKVKVFSLNKIICSLEKGSLASRSAVIALEETINDVPRAILERIFKSKDQGHQTRQQYSTVLRNFAMTLHFYSPKGYEYVREKFQLALPAQSTIRKWFGKVDCTPGFTELAFKLLQIKSEEAIKNGNQLLCSLMFDEMSIRKKLDATDKGTYGYVNIGCDVTNYEQELATQVLVFLVTCHTAPWKIPVAYFFIKSLSAEEKANLTKECLIKLADIGVTVVSVTCDGPSTNLSMAKSLGCDFTVNNFKTFFPHPKQSINSKVFFMLDVCHMLKLMRNCLSDLKVIHVPDGSEVKWEYIQKLFKIQEEQDLHLGNKLTRSHVYWHQQKMKVKLAAQVLSNSVADALAFLEKDMQLKEFEGAGPTIDFIRIINNIFDILNSRNPLSKGYKAPLNSSNIVLRKSYMLETIEYLKMCKNVSGKQIINTERKTPFLCFIIACMSVMGIHDTYVQGEAGQLKYLLTYKCSQDHLETFFCSVRAHNGWNNNPSALQFTRTYRRLLLHIDIKALGGNCQLLEDTVVLYDNDTSHVYDVGIKKKYFLGENEILEEDHDYCAPPVFISLSEYVKNVVAYIGGFVIRQTLKTIHCEECIDALMSTCVKNGNNLSLIVRKNKGGLFIPSQGVIKSVRKQKCKFASY